MKKIVILGGSFGGVPTAHLILKQAAKTGNFKITLVAPNTHFYWSLASPRGLVPGQLTDEQLFQPIAAGFSQYSASHFEFITASATGVDAEAKRVTISGPTGSSTLDYDFLILATGARTKETTPFKETGSTNATKGVLHDFQERVANAQKIVVAGGGVTGIETAGELAYEYGRQKQIILLASGTSLLEDTPASVSKIVINELHNLKVDLRFKTKVLNAAKTPDGQQELKLSDGSKLVADMYIPTFGVVPNSSYMPAKFLDRDGFVMVDEFLHVKGTEDIWAVGDVSDADWLQAVYCEQQSVHVAKNITLILSNKAPIPYKTPTSRMLGLQIGRNATGHLGNMKLPSFMLAWVRKNMLLERFDSTVNGLDFSLPWSIISWRRREASKGKAQ